LNSAALALLLVLLLRVSAAWGLAARAYVTSNTDQTLRAIEGTDVVPDHPSIGSSPFDVAVSPSALLVFVTNNGDGTVSQINANTLAPIGPPIALTQSPAPQAQPQFVAVHPDGTRLYVTDDSTNDLYVISDLSGSPSVSKRHLTDVGRLGQVVTVPGTPVKVYVLHQTPDPQNRGEVFVLDDSGIPLHDAISLHDTQTAATLGDPLRITRTPDAARVYVTFDSEKVAAIETATDTVLETCTIDRPRAQVVAVTPDGSRMLVSTRGPDSVRIFSLGTGDHCPGPCLDYFDMPPEPTGLAISRDGTQAYVVPRRREDKVAVISTSTMDTSHCDQELPTTTPTTIPINAPQAFGDFVGQDTGGSSSTTTTTTTSTTTSTSSSTTATTSTTTSTSPGSTMSTTTTTTSTTRTSTTTPPICGNGIREPGEDCDNGASNGFGNCCDAVTCRAEDSGTPCRFHRGPCEDDAFCQGGSVECPANTPKRSASICRIAAGECDQPEFCDGQNFACPPNRFKDRSTSCGPPPSGPCEGQALCSGNSAVCPPKTLTTDVCRPQVGECDIAESCLGDGPYCPPDQYADSTTPCGGSGTCQQPTMCSGVSPRCPTATPLQDGIDCSDPSCDAGGKCTNGQCQSLCAGDATVAGGVQKVSVTCTLDDLKGDTPAKCTVEGFALGSSPGIALDATGDGCVPGCPAQAGQRALKTKTAKFDGGRVRPNTGNRNAETDTSAPTNKNGKNYLKQHPNIAIGTCVTVTDHFGNVRRKQCPAVVTKAHKGKGR